MALWLSTDPSEAPAEIVVPPAMVPKVGQFVFGSPVKAKVRALARGDRLVLRLEEIDGAAA